MNYKKSISKIVVVLCFIVGILSIFTIQKYVYAESYYGDFNYEIVNEAKKYAQVTGYRGTSQTVKVPDEINGYKVVEISPECFDPTKVSPMSFEGNLTSVTLPTGLINLDAMSFLYQTQLKSIVIPEGTENIGANAFVGCDSLSSVTIPKTVTFIGGEISNQPNVIYNVQNGSYAQKCLTDLGVKLNVTGSKVAVSNISLGATDVEVNELGDEVWIYAILTPSNASNQHITWISSQKNVVTVDNSNFYNTGLRGCLLAKKAGTATITATTDDGNKVASCKVIVRPDLRQFSMKLSQTSFEYDGGAKKPTVVIDGLVNGTDYKVTYKGNVQVGTATVTATGIGQYTGSVSKTFSITSKKITTATTATQKPTVKVIKPKKPSGFKLVNKKSKKVVVSWKKVSSAKGYEIYRSTKKNSGYKCIKKITKNKTTLYTNSKLKKKKTYYYKIRSYRYNSGKKYVSSFTSVKKVVIKK